MPIPVDSRLTNAVQQWMARNNSSVYALANAIGITRTSIFSWINGTVKTVSDETWAKAEPFLGPYYDASAPVHPVRPDPYGDAVRQRAMKTPAAVVQPPEASTFTHARRWPPVGAPSPLGAETLNKFTRDEQAGEAEEAAAGIGAITNGQSARIWVRELPGMELGHLRVHGESMEPTLRDRDYVVCQHFQGAALHLGPGKNVPMGAITTLLRDGDLVLYSLDNGESIAIKRARLVKTGRTATHWVLWLEADNAEWSEANEFPRCITRDDDLIIYGKVLGRVVEGEALPKAAAVAPKPFLG